MTAPTLAEFLEWIQDKAKQRETDIDTQQMVRYTTKAVAEFIRSKDPEPKPFWSNCGLCNKPIQTEAEAEEIWVGPTNASGGKKGYIHTGNGTCLQG